MLDCGVPYSKLIKGVDYDLKNLQGVLLTHSHGDHSESASKLNENGYYIYSSSSTLEEIGVNGTVIKAREWVKIGDFQVYAFDVTHDAPEPFNYVIHHPEMGMMVFLTDTSECPVRFDIVDHWLIEANHDVGQLGSLVESGSMHYALANRIVSNHMSIGTCIKTLKENLLETTSTITLCHLSDGNSNEESFKKAVARSVGIMPNVARKGLEVHLQKL